MLRRQPGAPNPNQRFVNGGRAAGAANPNRRETDAERRIHKFIFNFIHTSTRFIFNNLFF